MGTDLPWASAVLGLSAAASWGAGDFSGGVATRRASAMPVILCSQIIGLSLFVLLAWLVREPLPPAADLAWGAAAGLSGLVGLSALYRGMAVGQMGLVAPISGVISASMPAAAGAVLHGLPEEMRLAGFAAAFAGVWFVSRTRHDAARPAGMGLAVLSGLGFGGFLILIAQAERGAVFWPLASARGVSVAALLALATVRRPFPGLPRSAVLPVAAAGVLDAAGNLLFLLAAQAGRLDVAGVLSSLYPATTVILALALLRERLSRQQMAGVALALIAIPLITMS